MKRLFVEYLRCCTHYWKEVAPQAALGQCSIKRGIIATVEDFDVRFIQPATEPLAAARIIGNTHMLIKLMPLDNTPQRIEANEVYYMLLSECVKIVEKEPHICH